MERKNGAARGAAEVHTHIGVQPRRGDGAAEGFEEAARSWAPELATPTPGGARRRGSGAADSPPSPAGGGPLEVIRENPLAALGLAFTAGFLLAGGRREPEGRLGGLKQQLRGALLGTLTAAIAQEIDHLLDREDAGESLSDRLADLRADARG